MDAAIWAALPEDLHANVLSRLAATQEGAAAVRLVGTEWRALANETPPLRDWHVRQLLPLGLRRSERPPAEKIPRDERGAWVSWMVLRRPGLTAKAAHWHGRDSRTSLDMCARAARKALCLACEHGQFDAVKHLVERVGLTAANVPRGNAFRAACRGGDLRVVEYLVEKTAMTREDVLVWGDEMLLGACHRGDLGLAKYLIECVGLTRGDVREWEDEALCAARRGGHTEIVELIREFCGPAGREA